MNRNIAIVLIITAFASVTYVSANTVSAEQDRSFAEIKMYENQEYRFTIEYPSGWILNDAIPQKNKWIEIVSFIPDTEDWSQGIYVNKWEGDLKDKDFDSNEYLENHNQAAQDWCSSLSISENGFACINYSLIEQKTVSISGRQSFLLEETWTRVDDKISSEVLVYNLQIPDGEDRWTIIAESRKEILNETSNILENSLNSFTLLDELEHGSVIEKISDQSSCESLGLDWIQPSTCHVNNMLKIDFGSRLIIDLGVKLKVSYSGTIDNKGTINIDGGSIDNNGIIDNKGGTINNNGGIIDNDGTIENNGGSIDNNDGTIINNGIIDNGIYGTLNDWGVLRGSGLINSDSIFTVKVLPPLKQLKHGTPLEEITCNDGFELIIKASNDSPACVKLGTTQKLIERGWAKT